MFFYGCYQGCEQGFEQGFDCNFANPKTFWNGGYDQVAIRVAISTLNRNPETTRFRFFLKSQSWPFSMVATMVSFQFPCWSLILIVDLDRWPWSLTLYCFSLTSIVDLESFFIDLVFDLIVYLIVYLDRLPQLFFVNLKFFFVDLIVDLVVDLRSGSGTKPFQNPFQKAYGLILKLFSI